LDRVLRGGNWNNNSNNCRSSNRNNNDPDNRNNNIGFRVASTPRFELWQVIAQAGRGVQRQGLGWLACSARWLRIICAHGLMALCLQLARITRKPSRAGNPAGGALYFELHMAGGNLNRKFEPQI
jgi:hypothetical protein